MNSLCRGSVEAEKQKAGSLRRERTGGRLFVFVTTRWLP